MINKLQSLKGKTKLKFCKNLSKYYDNMDNRLDQDTFAKMLKVLVKFILK